MPHEDKSLRRGRALHMGILAAVMGVGFFLLPHKVDKNPIPVRLPFSRFPQALGEWQGTPMPIPAKEQSILNADDDIMILYSKKEIEPSLLFYTVYYRHQTPEKNIHSPKNCLPGSGWAMIDTRDFDLNVSGTPFRVTQAVIQKGLDRQVVLYWYQERGRIFANEFLGRWYLVKDAMMLHRTDGALVRVSMPLVNGSIRKTVRTEIGFVRTVAPYLRKFIPGGSGRSSVLAKNGSDKEFPDAKQ